MGSEGRCDFIGISYSEATPGWGAIDSHVAKKRVEVLDRDFAKPLRRTDAKRELVRQAGDTALPMA